ncbi:MAG TPA: hypothetical protein VFV38_41035 [Ktedonobacteraceae bacterium]|nr:hypothetical protein [Ktedonobacteraceae bacterium]
MEQPFLTDLIGSPVAYARPFPERSSVRTQLLVDPQGHAILLLRLDDERRVSLLRSLPLSDSAARIFWELWRVYPAPCSYRDLFLALYPLPQEAEERTWARDFALRPIRRAVMALTPALRELGLAVVSLRGQGYVLTSSTTLPEAGCPLAGERTRDTW